MKNRFRGREDQFSLSFFFSGPLRGIEPILHTKTIEKWERLYAAIEYSELRHESAPTLKQLALTYGLLSFTFKALSAFPSAFLQMQGVVDLGGDAD